MLTAILLTWSLLTLFIRIAIRVRLNGPWSLDDSVIAAATVRLSTPELSTTLHSLALS